MQLEATANAKLVAKVEQEEDQDGEGTLALIRELMDSVRKEAMVDYLETAISGLQHARNTGVYSGESLTIIRRCFVKAHLTRFGIYGWTEDLDSCFAHLKCSESPINSTSQDNDKTIYEVQDAIQLIQECRKSLNTANLDTIICLANEAIESFSPNDNSVSCEERANILMVLGNAHVVRYLNQGQDEELDQAAAKFNEANDLCVAYVHLAYVCLVSLSHIEWLRYMESVDDKRMSKLRDYMERASTTDEEGSNALEAGLRMAENAADEVQIQKAIALLTASLHHRMRPHPRRFFSLQKLTAALMTRFRRRGSLNDLEQCIQLYRQAMVFLPRPHPNRSALINDLANALSVRFGQVGALPDLQECIMLHREALDLRPSPHPSRYMSLSNLASMLCQRFQQTGAFQDLEECIVLHEEAVNLTPSSHPNRPFPLENLANALFTRFHQKGSLQDLQECIMLRREALTILPASHPRRYSFLSNLANALTTRFEEIRDNQDLGECIMLRREVLSMVPETHPDRPTSLNHLANVLSTRFKYNGALEDLEESIKLYRKALEMLPTQHHSRSSLLNDLASAVCNRFKQKGDLQDLEEGIILHRIVIDSRPTPHPYRSSSLNDLAGALSTRFQHKGALQDLDDSITFYREALNLIPTPHPTRPWILYNLAGALWIRCSQNGFSQELDECIFLYRDALNLLPESHRNRSVTLTSLGVALSTRFEQDGALQDLEESIVLHQASLNMQPSSHPNRPMGLNNLANALSTRFNYKGIYQDLDNCIALHREAVNLLPPTSPTRFFTLNNVANAISTRFRRRGVGQDLDECVVLHREALSLVPASNPNRSPSLNNLARALFTRYEHNGVLEDLEESIVLHRDALDLRPFPHPERASSLNNLASSLSARYTQTGESTDIEECIKLHGEALDLRIAPNPDRRTSLNNLAFALSVRIKQRGALRDRISVNPATLASNSTIDISDSHHVSHEKDDGHDIEDALRYYEEASTYETGSLLKRLDSCKHWAAFARIYCPASALKAYCYAMELIRMLASLDLTLQQRQGVLEHTRELVCDAARCAMDANQYDVAVVFLSTGRSVFWSQALQLRTPIDELSATHPAIAERFLVISRQLEHASYSEPALASSPELLKTHHIESTYPSLAKLAAQQQQVIEEIRMIPGYEGFLVPPSFTSLQCAAEGGPIIFLNASSHGCDAIIMRRVKPLERIPLDIRTNELEELKMLVHGQMYARIGSVELSPKTSNTLIKILGRDMVSSTEDLSQDVLRLVLECLWVKVVEPVVTALGLKQLDLPTRVWWCPTGPFASLPIHAAGSYSDGANPINCIFHYAISSYCTSPQDLLHRMPLVTNNFMITAVIEPEAPGAAVLPATQAELMEIEKNITDQCHLVSCVGSKDAPNHVDDIVSDIQRSSFVHFGCHGMQNLKDPLQSYLLLSGGKLTMSKIIKGCKVPEGALAYLSACETAKGDEFRPDESLTLVATMMFAGFRSVVGTIWSIFDEDAPMVANVFYGHLFQKKSGEAPDVSDAAYGLYLATKELRGQGKPFSNWVPYVHYGI